MFSLMFPGRLHSHVLSLPVTTCLSYYTHTCQPAGRGTLTCPVVFTARLLESYCASGTGIIHKGRLWIADGVGMRDRWWISIPVPVVLLA